MSDAFVGKNNQSDVISLRQDLVGTRTLLGAPGLTTRNKDATRSSH